MGVSSGFGQILLWISSPLPSAIARVNLLWSRTFFYGLSTQPSDRWLICRRGKNFIRRNLLSFIYETLAGEKFLCIRFFGKDFDQTNFLSHLLIEEVNQILGSYVVLSAVKVDPILEWDFGYSFKMIMGRR